MFGLPTDLVVPVDFLYSVELAREIPETVFMSNILPTLENDFVQKLVPVYFSAQCPTKRLRLRGRQLALAVTGISAAPPDTIDETVACDAQFCFGVAGQMTLYLEETGTRRLQQETSTDDTLRGFLKEKIDAGAFDNAHPDIVKVTYVEARANGDDDVIPPIINDERSSNNDNINDKVVWPLVAACALLLLVVALLLYSRRDSEIEDSESEDEERGAGDRGIIVPETPEQSLDAVKEYSEGQGEEEDDTAEAHVPGSAQHTQSAPDVVHHPHSHPIDTTDVDDSLEVRHSSRVATGLLEVIDEHKNLSVVHLHEHIK